MCEMPIAVTEHSPGGSGVSRGSRGSEELLPHWAAVGTVQPDCSGPGKRLPTRRAPREGGQQSAFSLSKELSILVKVFLIRRAVSLADGL